MNRSISILVAIVFFLFGAGALYVLASKGIIVVQPMVSPSPSAMVIATTPTPSATPAMTAEPSLMPATSPSPSPMVKKSMIEGTLGYPSEGIPPLEVYAINTNDNTKNASIKTAQNVSSFSIVVEPGTYYVVAYPQGNGGGLTGGYTKAVPCGLTVDCKDHSLIPVVVGQGKTVSSVEVKDWYAPAGTFPPKP